MNVVIANANVEDAFSISVLTQQLGYRVNEIETATRLRDLIKSKDHGVFVARDENGVVYGWVVVEIRLSLEGGRKAEITGLVVGESFRKLGIGSQLVAKSEFWAIKLGVSKLIVRSNIERDQAHKFYNEAGFTLMKTSHYYEKGLKNRCLSVSKPKKIE